MHHVRPPQEIHNHTDSEVSNIWTEVAKSVKVRFSLRERNWVRSEIINGEDLYRIFSSLQDLNINVIFLYHNLADHPSPTPDLPHLLGHILGQT